MRVSFTKGDFMPGSNRWLLVFVAALATAQLGCDGNSVTDPGLDTRKIEALSPTVIVGTVGGFSPVAPAIRITGSKSGKPEAGVRVEFVFRDSIGSHYVVTDSAGIASAGEWQFGQRPGLYQLVAFVGGFPAVTFSATVKADRPHHFQILMENQARIAGQMIDRLFLRVEDRFGNGIPELEVNFRVDAGGGTLGTGKTTTDQDGWAHAQRWRLGAGANQASASAAGLEPAIFRAEGLDSAALKWYKLEGLKNGASEISFEAALIVDARIALTPFDTCLCRQQQGYLIRTTTYAFGGTTTTTTESAPYVLEGAEVSTPQNIARGSIDRDGLVLQGPDVWDGETWTWTYREVKAGTAESLVPLEELVFAKLSDRQIYRAKPDGTSLTRLTSSEQNSRPAWSPDRRRIAFAKNFPGTQNRGWGINDIYVMDGDGSNVKRLTEKGDLWSAAWSPDGRKLAVSDEGVYESDIWVITVDGGGSAPVHLAKDAKLPAWSPDGEQIAYVHTSGDDGYNQVYVMNADGTVARPLTEIDPGGIGGLAWSPDGKRIAFSKCLAGSCDLYFMDAGGGPPRRITNVGNAQWAAWSPDGKWIAVTLSTYTGSEWHPSVAYVSAEGGTPRVIVEDAFWPSWR